jgi:hypothetical protein
MEIRMAAVRLLLDVAMAYGNPPQRQALGALLQVLQTQFPPGDAHARVLQPQVRALIVEALHAPTPALVHGMYCYPASFSLMGVARGEVRQPQTLEEVTMQVKTWLERLGQRQPNWLAVVSFVAWTRHLARLDDCDSLTTTMEALLKVYELAFHYSEQSYQWEETLGSQTQAARDAKPGALRAGPSRFMIEFLGLVEALYMRFGPGPVRSAVKTLIGELLGELQGDQLTADRLPESTWHLQVLRLFGTLTGRSAPWLRATGTAQQERSAHPNSWKLASWHDELRKMQFSRFLLRTFQAALMPERARLRRPQWTATLVSLIRNIWRNLLAAPSAGRQAKHIPLSTILETHCKDDVLILDLLHKGLVDFFAFCIGSSGDNAISSINVVAAPESTAEPLHTLRRAGIALLEDVVSAGCKHGNLVDALAGLVTRRFIDGQLRLLHSHTPGLRESTARLLLTLHRLGMPWLSNLIQQAGVMPKDLEASIKSTQSHAIDQSAGSAEARGHPLELHRFQVGELTGGFRAVSQELTTAQPAPDKPSVALRKANPAGTTQSRLRTEVVVQPKKQRPTSRGRAGYNSG